jgi:exonuclease SbcD
LQLDFGETANDPAVNLVDVHPGLPADVRSVALAAGRRLRTLRGTLADVVDGAGDAADDHLRIVLDEPARAGLADEVRSLLPNTVEVVLAPSRDAAPVPMLDPDRLRRTPHDLLTEYLGEHDAHDKRVVALFDELADDLIADVSEAAR